MRVMYTLELLVSVSGTGFGKRKLLVGCAFVGCGRCPIYAVAIGLMQPCGIIFPGNWLPGPTPAGIAAWPPALICPGTQFATNFPVLSPQSLNSPPRSLPAPTSTLRPFER